MSVEKIEAELHQVLGALDLAALVHALKTIDQAETALTRATEGSQRPESAHALGLLAHVKQRLGQIYQQVEAARKLVQQYLANIAGGGAIAGNTSSLTSTVTPTTPDSSADKPKQISDILATLPPKVPKPNPTGKKTFGKVVGSEEVITSGVDEESAEVWQRLIEAGLSPRRKPMSIHHVEMKVALRMVKNGTKNLELTINNRPCLGFLSCDKLLPVLLPEGYTLTVYGPDCKGVFKGGKKWSS
ncbi:DddA-like double-stranded DNA deaminase toxin [Actinokineospora sp. 24-640]